MGESVPGTIVSVLQAAAEAAEDAVAGSTDLGGVVTAATDAAVIALDKTTEQLDVLADAGVVDAGGRGLLVLLDSLSKTVSGHAPDATGVCARPARCRQHRRRTRPALRGDVPTERLPSPTASSISVNALTNSVIRSPSRRPRPTAAVVIRCTCIPTTRAAPSRPRCRSGHRAGSRSPRSPAVQRTHRAAGHASVPCWRSSTVTEPPSSSQAKVPTSCGPIRLRRTRRPR